MAPVPMAVLRECVTGAFEVEQLDDGLAPQRMPVAVRPRLPDPAVGWVYAQTAGVRLRMRTAATRLRLQATFTRNAGPRVRMLPVTMTAEIDGQECWHGALDEGTRILGDLDGGVRTIIGGRSAIDIMLGGDGDERVVDVWLPHRAQTVLHLLEADAHVAPADEGRGLKWVHHGSSISHGHAAMWPTSTWPHQVARVLGWELTDLGFSGNAMLDPWVAERIARAEADVITLKIGINVVGADAFRQRTFSPAMHGFLDTIRRGHPRTPVMLISALACPANEQTPGPTAADEHGWFRSTRRADESRDPGALTLVDTRRLLGDVVAVRNDDRLELLDGLSLFGLEDAAHLHDGLHPDQSGHNLIASRAVALLHGALARMTAPASCHD